MQRNKGTKTIFAQNVPLLKLQTFYFQLQSQKLQTELENAEDQRTQEAEKRAETIRQLKGDLHQIEQFAQESSKRVTSEVEKVKSWR